jgi:hypothetical protein
MKKIYALLLITGMIYGPLRLSASERDSTDFKRNIIHWNLTPIFVVGPKSLVFGYERVLKNNKSFSINAGYLEKAPMEDQEGNPIKLFDQSSRGGFDVTGDFRFYFKKRNKYPAPDGLYWGPYAGYYTLWQDASLNLLDNGSIKNTVYYNARLQMTNIGIQLGYQFVFKHHITLDLILFGPSLSFYNLNMGLKFKTEIDPDDPFYADLMEFLQGNNGFLAEFIRNQSFDASGRLNFSYYGFRYAVQLGYNF